MKELIPFTRTYSDESDFDWSDFDVVWFCEINSRDVAVKRLSFLSSPGNVYKLLQQGYGGEPLAKMWKATLRAAVGFGVPLTATQTHLALEHGIAL